MIGLFPHPAGLRIWSPHIRGDLTQHLALCLDRGMHIDVHRDGRLRVAEHHGQCLDVALCLDATSSKGVTQRMEADILGQTGTAQQPLEVVTHHSPFYRFRSAGEKKILWRIIRNDKSEEYLRLYAQRDSAHRGLCLGLLQHDC